MYIFYSHECTVGTKQGAKSIDVLELLPPPPVSRDSTNNPWPEYPNVWRVEYGHSEVALHFGRDPRQFNVMTKAFLDNGDGHVAGLQLVSVEWTKDPDNGRFTMKEVPGRSASLLFPFAVVMALPHVNFNHSLWATVCLHDLLFSSQ